MSIHPARATVAALMCLAVLQAADIQGKLVIERKLTRRNVTASIGAYQRGAAVPLGTNAAEDPLAFERTHVAVWLDGNVPAAPAIASMAQRDRRFSPDFLVIPAGSTVSFPNGDTVFHNVFSLSRPRSFDLGNYSKGQTRQVTFPRPGIVFVNCRLHPNMAAVIVVTPNQWNATSDAEGRFTLHGVPPGTYTVVAWHKSAGFFRQTVNVSDDGATAVQFIIPLRADGPGHEMAQR